MVMMVSFSTEGYQILQILEGESSVHRLNILNQIKSYSTFGGRGFDVGVVNETLKEMTEQGYIDFVEKIDSFKITQKGLDALN